MEGAVMQKLADALGGAGFAVKKIEEETYSRFERPDAGEKYTGEIILKIRPIKDEEADAEKPAARQEEKTAKNRPPSPEAADQKEAEF
jgi:hypothetical protein